jgi:hypothetical protein
MAIASQIHHAVIRSFVERGVAPTADEIATALAIGVDDVRAGLHELHAGHGLVLHPDSAAIWIAHPFATAPTGVWVEAAVRGWWAPCVWCAAGIVALAASRRATIHARIGGERDVVEISVEQGSAASELVVHFAIPPRDAWANVSHWCSTVQPFRSEREVDAWCARHRIPRGDVVPLSRVLELGRAWYGGHLDPSWRKWTLAQARQIFERVGLHGPFWALPDDDVTF